MADDEHARGGPLSNWQIAQALEVGVRSVDGLRRIFVEQKCLPASPEVEEP